MSQLTAVRRMLGGMFLFGSAGTGAELVLLEHTEGVWQTAPLVLIGLGCVVLAALAMRPSAAGVRAFQVAMALFVASGIRGAVLCEQHIRDISDERWQAEGWVPLPESSQGIHGTNYQCQRCSPDGTALGTRKVFSGS